MLDGTLAPGLGSECPPEASGLRSWASLAWLLPSPWEDHCWPPAPMGTWRAQLQPRLPPGSAPVGTADSPPEHRLQTWVAFVLITPLDLRQAHDALKKGVQASGKRHHWEHQCSDEEAQACWSDEQG